MFRGRLPFKIKEVKEIIGFDLNRIKLSAANKAAFAYV
jgi:hypothetical protein